ncbi:MAG: hypothetical protein JXB24_01615 [Bacteroidales bacterium]|nr:hypothetical protein [Bacteroidales bacterium]
MKSRFLAILLTGMIVSAYGQNSGNFTAMILSLDGNGVILRNSKKIPLELPQSYFPGDELSLMKGNALIMLFSGEEIPLAAVSSYKIPPEDNSVSSELYEMANDSRTGQSLLAQSGTAYRIRGKSNVFPIKSKVLKTDDVILRLYYKNPEELNLGLKVIDSQTQKVIYEMENVADSLISLADAHWIEGRSYYWTLSNTPNGKPEMGTIVIPAKDESENFNTIAEPDTHFEYLNAISNLHNNLYYFDACALIEKAIARYPDFKIYRILKENLLLE